MNNDPPDDIAPPDSQPLAPIPRLLLRPDEAAASLGISVRALWSETKAGNIPAVRIGKSVRYSEEALRDWIRSRHEG